MLILDAGRAERMIYRWLKMRKQRLIENFAEALITYSIIATLWIVSWLYELGWRLGFLMVLAFLVNGFRDLVRVTRQQINEWRMLRGTAGPLDTDTQPST